MAKCKAHTKSGKRCKNTSVEGSDFCWIESHQDESESNLNPKQEKFCQLFVTQEFFANGTQSYIEAYNIKIKNEKDINTAAASASRLLRNVKICNRINDLLDSAGLNDEFVDKQLLFMITQQADFTQKMAAIREYNKLKSRITEKLDVNVKSEPWDPAKGDPKEYVQSQVARN